MQISNSHYHSLPILHNEDRNNTMFCRSHHGNLNKLIVARNNAHQVCNGVIRIRYFTVSKRCDNSECYTDKRYGYLDLCIFLLKKEGLSICDLVTLKKVFITKQSEHNAPENFVKTRTLYLFDKCLICFRISGISGITIIPMNVTITSAPRLPMACDEARGSEAEIFFRAFDDRALLLRSSSLLSLSIHA